MSDDERAIRDLIATWLEASRAGAVVDRLYQETQKALRDPNVVEKFKPQGVEPLTLTPAEFDALVKKEIEANLALVKAAGLKFN